MKLSAFALLIALVTPSDPQRLIVRCPDEPCVVPQEEMQKMVDEVISLRRGLALQCAIVRGT